jgi:hypothetical protein
LVLEREKDNRQKDSFKTIFFSGWQGEKSYCNHNHKVSCSRQQGCQTAHVKFPIWVQYGGPWNEEFYGHLKHLMVIWYTPMPSGNFVVIWYIFHRFGTLYRVKSGSPALVFICMKGTCCRYQPIPKSNIQYECGQPLKWDG